MARRPLQDALTDRLGATEALDAPAAAVAKQVRSTLGTGTVKDLLSGTWQGHPLHPALTDVVIGAWTSATILDLIGGRESRRAAERLIGVGIAAALPTAASGSADWADSTLGDEQVRRVGFVHAVANTAALGLYGASLLARRRGRHRRGVGLGAAGAGLLLGSGFLGGHLTFARGIGVDQTIFDARPDEWTDAIAADELAEGEARTGGVDGTEIMLVRTGGTVRALDDRCCHRGGPLHEGELAEGTVTCPWHGSVFRLDDGSVERGPATYPQPAYDTRVQDGRIQIRLQRPA
jgi:nitrite reductase/ring-hydroxylating ferredoxin subunit/uncharacterized membrane protein